MTKTRLLLGAIALTFIAGVVGVIFYACNKDNNGSALESNVALKKQIEGYTPDGSGGGGGGGEATAKFVLRHAGNCTCPGCTCGSVCPCPLGVCLCSGLSSLTSSLTAEEIDAGYGSATILSNGRDQVTFIFNQPTALENGIVPFSGGDFLYVDIELARKIGLKSAFIIHQGEYVADLALGKFGHLIVPIEYVEY